MHDICSAVIGIYRQENKRTAFNNALLINGKKSIKMSAASKHTLFPDRDPASADIID
jgi:phage terminase large subunit-like protein